MNHYVYLITNITIWKGYIGTRSCLIDPINDIGIKYFSSSTDKDFINDQKENPNNYKYEVLRTFETRELALIKEIELHKEFDVAKSNLFYNLSRQTSTGFISDTSGTVSAFNIKENKSGRWPKEDFDNNRDNYIFFTEGTVPAFNIIENTWGRWLKADFANNRDNYIMATEKVVTAFSIKDNRLSNWDKKDFDQDRSNYVAVCEGMVNAFNIKEDIWGQWDKKDFDKNRSNYRCANEGMVTVFSIKDGCSGNWPKDIVDNNKSNYLNMTSNAYRKLIDPTFIKLPDQNDKKFVRCFDGITLGVVIFSKKDAKNRDKNRYPAASGPGKKSIFIREKRKFIPNKNLPKPKLWVS